MRLGPLSGKRVLVTRAREQAGSLAAMLDEQGAVPLVCPAIEIVAPSDPAPFAKALADVRGGGYRWI
ncbi:MAG: uroporphyrinogen-III synthase, partial [Polyangiaceae bacterium]